MHEIKIDTPKSTLSNWCQGVVLPSWYNRKIKKLNDKNLTKAQRIAWASVKRKRELYLKKVQKEALIILKKFNLEGLKIALAMLYLGEGAKWKGHSGLMLGSSDPNIILLYISLLKKCYRIESKILKCRVSYRADQNIKELEKYWSTLTGIPQENFYKTKPDPRTEGKKTKKVDYKGVCVLTCAGAKIQLELEEIARLLYIKIMGR
ncbi:MAG: hypothetical protein HY219_02050 [Candidatus Staskawiczbacteria bacterium]|nr:hypothetical protein [Candidatus Staskawiczbacteria bacterium]